MAAYYSHLRETNKWVYKKIIDPVEGGTTRGGNPENVSLKL